MKRPTALVSAAILAYGSAHLSDISVAQAQYSSSSPYLGCNADSVYGCNPILLCPSDHTQLCISAFNWRTPFAAIDPATGAVTALSTFLNGLNFSGANVTGTGQTTAVPLSVLYGDRPSARFFGAANASGHWNGDGVNDDAPAINAALASYCSLPNGANIEIPAGTIAIGSTIINACSNVHLFGHGTGAPFHDVGVSAPDASTAFKWTGATGGTMMRVSPNPNVISGRRLSNDDVEGIQFNCDNLAGTGLDWRSTSGSKIHVSYNECTAHGLRIDTVPLAEFNDPQGNEIWVEGSTILSTGDGVLCDGTAGTGSANNGNCSLNRFRHVVLRNKNGDGLVFGYSDHNIVEYLNVQPAAGGAAGRTVVFKAGAQIGTSGNGYVAYNNRIDYLTGPEPYVAQGTETAAYPSHDNSITFLDRNNSAPFVTAGTGATFKTWTDAGNMFGVNVPFGINTDTPADAWDVNGFINTQNGLKLNHSTVIDASNNAGFSSVTVANALSPGQRTVGTLGTCSGTQKGQAFVVTDASGATWGSTITGGGTQIVLAICNGSIWVAH